MDPRPLVLDPVTKQIPQLSVQSANGPQRSSIPEVSTGCYYYSC